MAGGLNAYGFGVGDPINFGDPFGLCPPCDSKDSQAFVDQMAGLAPAINYEVATFIPRNLLAVAFGAITDAVVGAVADVLDGAVGASRATSEIEAPRTNFTKGSPRPSPKFQPPTNPPQNPPADIPAGWRIRRGAPNEQYPNGYWKLEKPMENGGWQGIDPSTMKPGTRPETHVEFPPPGGQ